MSLLSLETYASRMAGKWESTSGFLFRWTETFDSYAKAKDIAHITLANDCQSSMALQANADAIRKTVEAFAAPLAIESTEFPEEEFPPGEWYSFEAGRFDEITLKELFIRVYYPGTKQITSTFAKLYELLAQAKQFVYDPDLPDEEIQVLDQGIYDSYLRQERFLGIQMAAYDHFRLRLTADQTLGIYQWFEAHNSKFEVNPDEGYFYPDVEALGASLASLPITVQAVVVE